MKKKKTKESKTEERVENKEYTYRDNEMMRNDLGDDIILAREKDKFNNNFI